MCRIQHKLVTTTLVYKYYILDKPISLVTWELNKYLRYLLEKIWDMQLFQELSVHNWTKQQPLVKFAQYLVGEKALRNPTPDMRRCNLRSQACWTHLEILAK
jgi:hypothetical protein